MQLECSSLFWNVYEFHMWKRGFGTRKRIQLEHCLSPSRNFALHDRRRRSAGRPKQQAAGRLARTCHRRLRMGGNYLMEWLTRTRGESDLLEAPFFSAKTGNPRTQSAGECVRVSKSFGCRGSWGAGQPSLGCEGLSEARRARATSCGFLTSRRADSRSAQIPSPPLKRP